MLSGVWMLVVPAGTKVNRSHAVVQVIKQQLADGVKTRRVGFVSKGAPARAHSEIQTPDGETVRV